MNRTEIISFCEDIDIAANPYKYDQLTQVRLAKVDDKSLIANGKWCFDANERAYIICPDIDATSTRGVIKMRDNSIKVSADDIVEIEFDMQSSDIPEGQKFGVALDFLSDGLGTILSSGQFLCESQSAGYETYNFTYIVPTVVGQNKKFDISIGTITSPLAGANYTCKIRDIKIAITHNRGSIYGDMPIIIPITPAAGFTLFGDLESNLIYKEGKKISVYFNLNANPFINSEVVMFILPAICRPIKNINAFASTGTYEVFPIIINNTGQVLTKLPASLVDVFRVKGSFDFYIV